MHGFRGTEATMCMASGETRPQCAWLQGNRGHNVHGFRGNEATMCMASGEMRPQCAWLQGKRGHNVGLASGGN